MQVFPLPILFILNLVTGLASTKALKCDARHRSVMAATPPFLTAAHLVQPADDDGAPALLHSWNHDPRILDPAVFRVAANPCMARGLTPLSRCPTSRIVPSRQVQFSVAFMILGGIIAA